MAFKPPEGLPKLSGITSTLSTPEVQFEKMVKEAAKVELPTGPLSMLTKLQESFEAGKNPELPEVPKVENILARLPELPKLPEMAGLPKLPGLPIIESGEEKPGAGYQPAKEEKKTERGYVPLE